MKKTALFTLALVAAVPAVAAPLMKPGLWELSSQNQMQGMTMPAMPAIPPEQLARMKEMGVKMPSMGGQGMAVTVRHCVTKEQAEGSVPPQPKENQRCQQKSVSRSGNTLNWSVECSGEHPATGGGTITFESDERYSGDSTITMQNAQHGPNSNGPITMKQHYSGKWLSASCDAK